MTNVIEIVGLSDPALHVYARLTEAQLRHRQCPEEGLFIAEGTTVIGHALDAGYQIVSFLMERKHIEGKARELIARCPLGTPVYTGESAVLAELTGFALTRGVLAAMRRRPLPTADALLAGKSRVAVLENIVDPTNVGAIFRSAAALGMEAVLLSPACCDPLNRRAVRVSMGTVFQVPWARLGERRCDWPERGMETLRAHGFATAALALDRRAVSIEDPRLRAEARLAVVLGTEGDGLGKETIAKADYTVVIPMSNGVDSLNVAAASAVAFWEMRKRETE